ncbi:MAG: nitrogen fixation protein NifH, partial [Thermoplasmata archaeon]|nr:nitrogen fixation protein NifH [Thermoplasmata archaeon]
MIDSTPTRTGQQVMDWLLEEDQPSVRYYTLIDLLGHKESEPEVREAHSKIPKRGWAQEILKLQKPGGYWE